MQKENNIFRILLNGNDILNININPINSINITSIVDFSICDKLNIDPISSTNNTLITDVTLTGIDLYKTFFKKSPSTLSLLSSNARKNDGIPIVRELINDI